MSATHEGGRVYDIHGRRLRVRAPGPMATRMLDHVFAAYVDEDGDGAVDLAIDVDPTADPTLPVDLVDAGLAEDGTRFRRAPDGTLVVSVDGLGVAVVDPGGRTARVHPRNDDPDWRTGHQLVEPVVVELLRGRGLYGIHASAVARDGQGLLLCGRSGSGKSTTALALARSGWGFLGDDTCYLDGTVDPSPVRARWSDVHLTPRSLDVVIAPEDRHAAFLPEGSEKYFLPIRNLTSVRPVPECEPRWLVFPEIADAREAELTPIPPEDALTRLVTQSIVPGRESAVRAHFDALVALCGRVSCHRLRAGGDLGSVTSALMRLTDL